MVVSGKCIGLDKLNYKRNSMPDVSILFCLGLAVIAILYSSVGHGGASGYLALLALTGFSPTVMKSTALILNVFVSLIAFIQYYRTKNFNWAILVPLVIASVPAAFYGGTISLDTKIYKPILGVILLFAAFRFFYSPHKTELISTKVNVLILLITGGIIGLISGMIGIGGGVILSPIIILLGWADIKQTAGISALFIFLNSLAGLGGNLLNGINYSPGMFMMIAFAIAGGFIGSYLGSKYLLPSILKRVLAVVLVLASIKLILP